jgi:TorA maturation chaperone TorD
MIDSLLPADIAEALSEDAETLALIHDRELTPELLKGLRATGFPGNLVLLPSTDGARKAWQAMTAALEQMPAIPDRAELDGLDADFAAIYLTAAYGVSPCESTWIDEDHLVCQEAMFQLRGIYQAAGLAAKDWRRRSDDHLVLQLAYIAHALRCAAGVEDWRSIGKIMDEHLLRWLPDFASRTAMRCETAFYAGLAVLTNAWCEEFRDLLADALGEPRPSREEVELRMKPAAAVQAVPVAFMPGVGPTI